MAIKTVSRTQPAVSADPELARREQWRQAWEQNRDQWGRPYVMLPDGSRERGYRRASSYGAPLEDSSALDRWKLRQVARGVARRDDLRLAVTRAEVGLDGPGEAAKVAKRELDGLCEQAMDVVESGAKASIGTSLHHVFELIDTGRDPGHVPEQWAPDVAAYRKLTEGVFRVLSAEMIVVQDDHQVGGTLDRAVEVLMPTSITDRDGAVVAQLDPGDVIIGDVKTSQQMDFAGAKFGVQVWCYATSHPYNPVDKIRYPWPHRPPRQDWAVIFHVASGSGKAQLHWVDLTLYAEAADQARRTYEWRNRLGKSGISRGSIVEDYAVTAAAATSEFDLHAAYERAKAAGEWNDILRRVFTRRKLELLNAMNGAVQ